MEAPIITARVDCVYCSPRHTRFMYIMLAIWIAIGFVMTYLYFSEKAISDRRFEDYNKQIETAKAKVELYKRMNVTYHDALNVLSEACRSKLK